MEKFQERLHKCVVLLTRETATDNDLLAKSDIVVCTPDIWDKFTKKWQTQPGFPHVELFIVDDLHHIGGHNGVSDTAVCFQISAFNRAEFIYIVKVSNELLFTSLAKEVMFLVALVCLFVCLFVCEQHYSKSYERIGMKFYGRVLSSTSKN